MTAEELSPDPGAVATLEDLSRELDLLRRRAARGSRRTKVGLDELSERVDLPRSTVHSYLSGRVLAPAVVLDRLVIALGASTAEQAAWAGAWDRVADRRERRARGTDTSPLPSSSQEPSQSPFRSPWPIPHQLTSQVSGFVGRTGELAELDDALTGPTASVQRTSMPIVVITGTAGVGKTALAVRWSHSALAHFPDGQLFLDLHGYDQRRPVDRLGALAALLTGLGVVPSQLPAGAQQRASLWRTMTTGRRLLVVLDNARGAADVRDLLPGSETCAVVVTSRDALAGLVARDGAHRIVLRRFSQTESITLLSTLIGQRIDHDPSSAGVIARRCAQLPLALRVAADLLDAQPELTAARLAADLDGGHDALTLMSVGDDEHAAVRTVFSWSLHTLPDHARASFRLLGLHPGTTVGLADAAALAGDAVPDARVALTTLHRAHLIENSAADAYRMHDLLRAYARELAAQLPAEVRHAALHRLSQHYLRTAAAAIDLGYPTLAASDKLLTAPPLPDDRAPVDTSTAREWLVANHKELLASIRGQIVGGEVHPPTYPIDLARTIGPYVDAHGDHHDAVLLHRAAVSAAQWLGDRAAEAVAQRDLATAYWQLGKPSEAITHYQRAAELSEEVDDHHTHSRALAGLGWVLFQQDRYDEALAYAERAVTAATAADRPVIAERALTITASVHLRKGDLATALTCYQRAADQARASDLDIAAANALSNVGGCLHLLGRYTEALAALSTGLQVAERIGHRALTATIIDIQGQVLCAMGDTAGAIEAQERASRIATDMNNPALRTNLLNNLGDTLRAAGRTGQALSCHQQAATIAADNGYRHEHARAHHSLGLLYRDTGEHTCAVQHWRTALAIRRDLETPDTTELLALLDGVDQPR